MQPNLAQTGAVLDQGVERGVDLHGATGEVKGLERLQLAYKQNSGTARGPQLARARTRRDFMFRNSVGDASPWGAFPRFSLMVDGAPSSAVAGAAKSSRVSKASAIVQCFNASMLLRESGGFLLFRFCNFAEGNEKTRLRRSRGR